MLTQLRKRKEGFTIIEVLIVLAIAGLILLVVFLAVPALQRNSRNTQRKNEVSSILGAVNEWTNNNGGKLPSASGSERADALGNAKLSFYTGNVTWATGAQTNGTSTDSAVIVTGGKCNGANSVAGSARQLVVLYTVETGGGEQKLCQES